MVLPEPTIVTPPYSICHTLQALQQPLSIRLGPGLEAIEPGSWPSGRAFKPVFRYPLAYDSYLRLARHVVALS